MKWEALKEEAKRWESRLEGVHKAWVRWTANESMAASLRTVSLGCAAASEVGGVVLDLGSGFSSAAFRFAKIPVVTIDDDVDWLEATGRFLDHQTISRGVLKTGSVWKTGTYSFVFYDLGNLDTRCDLVSSAFQCVKERGLILLDDMHVLKYQRMVRSSSEGFKELDKVPAFTRDKYKRWSTLMHHVS